MSENVLDWTKDTVLLCVYVVYNVSIDIIFLGSKVDFKDFIVFYLPIDVANVVLLYQALGSNSGQEMLSSLITRGRGRMMSYLCMIITRSLMV